MTSHRLLQLNAVSTAACGVGMLAARQALLAFTVADVFWVAASAVVLLMFWTDFAAIARFLIIAVGIVVEVFATLQFRAAGELNRARLKTA